MGKKLYPWSINRAVFLLFFTLAVFQEIVAGESTEAFFNWNLLWAGSWTRSLNLAREELSPDLLFQGGTLVNRGDLRIGLTRQGLDLRIQGIDRRVIPGGTGHINPGLGLYFDGGGILGMSRLLYGVLDEYGLSARIRNVWIRSPPYAENRRPMMSDLRRDPSNREPETYLYFGLPQFDLSQWGLLSGFASVQADDEFNPAFGGGFDIRPNRTTNFRLEGFYTHRLLDARDTNSWFSLSAPLPEREFRLFVLGTALETRYIGVAADLAYSEVFAWGQDIYGNAAFRLGNRPWRLSLAAEGTGSRYVDRAGNTSAQGFRLAGRLERQWIRSGLFRFNTVLRSPGWAEDFERGSMQIYFRPSAPPGRTLPLFRFSRASLSLGRNAVNPMKTEDSLDVLAAFNLRTLRLVVTGSLDSQSVFDADKSPFPLLIAPGFENFGSAKFSAEAAYNIKGLQLRHKIGYMIRAEREPIWDFSLHGALRMGKLGRVSLRIAAPEFPDKWNYALSWRMEMSSR